MHPWKFWFDWSPLLRNVSVQCTLIQITAYIIGWFLIIFFSGVRYTWFSFFLFLLLFCVLHTYNLVRTRMKTSIKAKLNKSDDQTNENLQIIKHYYKIFVYTCPNKILYRFAPKLFYRDSSLMILCLIVLWVIIDKSNVYEDHIIS